jgi:hypothetical protein
MMLSKIPYRFLADPAVGPLIQRIWRREARRERDLLPATYKLP